MWRALELDGEVLLFDRDTGTNVLIDNAKTRGLKRAAPRMLQVAITNACDKDCSFCYRPMEAKNRWTFDDIVELAHVCDRWGVLEIAFGGGEPTLFPRFPELLREIWTTTGMCPSFTTHGKRLTPELLGAIRGYYGSCKSRSTTRTTPTRSSSCCSPSTRGSGSTTSSRPSACARSRPT